MRSSRLHVAALLAMGISACEEERESPADQTVHSAEAGTADRGAHFEHGLDQALALDAHADTRGDTSMPDAGPAPDAPKSCKPPPPVSTLALFAKLEADLQKLTSSAARKARVDAFFAAVSHAGGVPVRDQNVVLFAVQATVSGPLRVSGSFNSWSTSADVMARFSGTDMYYLKKKLGAARHEYKYIDGKGAWHKDPNNRHVAWDGIPVAGLGKFNSVIPPWSALQPKGRLEWLRVKSPQLNHTRDVFIYLPPDYDAETCKRYPVLFINDGNESIARSQLDQVAASTFAAKKASPAILVFVALASQNDRMSEYSCAASSRGPKYTDFLCDTLATLLDKRYRTQATATGRGIIGASMGGLISYAALFWRNDCLRLAGAQSGSFWFDDNAMIKRVKSTSPKLKLLRAYLDNGTDNRQSTLQMRDALKAAGHSVVHWENLKQAHTWGAWKDRFDEALTALLPP